ncbi:MAG: DUF3037 domain-containing protein [Chloroflexi bacterium]|nr:DUF3037 domain-containing protein [Chloroflexota bacterium]
MSSNDFAPYQYSIIRYHHDATTHEFLNIGVALYSPKFKYFRAQVTSKYQRITNTFYNAKGRDYRKYVDKIARRFDSLSQQLEEKQTRLFETTPDNIEDLLRTFIRKDSSFRYSVPASGIAPDNPDSLDQTFEQLFSDYVDRYVVTDERESRTELEVWRSAFRPEIEKVSPEVLVKLEPVRIKTKIESLEYDYSYLNGNRHIIEPLSFDLTNPSNIQRKAHTTLGKNVMLSSSNEVSHLYLLLGKPQNKPNDVLESYEKAKRIVVAETFNFEVQIFEEESARDFAHFLRSIARS